MTFEQPTATVISVRGRADGALANLAKWDIPIVFVALAVIGALLPSNLQYLASSILILGLFAMATNVLVGWVGLVTFGQALFFAVGGYWVALMRHGDWSPVALVVVGAALAAVVAAVVGFLSVRLTGIAFAQMTLVFGQVGWLLIFTIKPLAGDNGIPNIPAGDFFGIDLKAPLAFWFYVLVMVFIVIALLRVVHRSSYGRNLLATRDNAVRALALGVPVRSIRIVAIIIAGTVAGVAGALFAQLQGLISAENAYWSWSGNAVVMCLIGGTAVFWGPMLGALIFQVLETQVFSGISYSSLYIGAILLAVVLLLRGGVLGLPVSIRFWVRRYRSWRAGVSARKLVSQ